MTARTALPDRSRTNAQVLVRVIDDLLDCLELWHRAGCDDARWIAHHWHRTFAPCLGVELPAPVLVAVDARDAHEALLAWQTAVAQR